MKTKSLLVLALVAVTTVVAAGCMDTTPTDDMMVDTGTMVDTTMPTDTVNTDDTAVTADDQATVDAIVNEVDTTSDTTDAQ